MTKNKLSEKFIPKVVTVNFPFDATIIDEVEQELATRASQDIDKCSGYFPGMRDRSDIFSDLPISQQFAKEAETLRVEGKTLNFNFLRLSLIDQTSISPFHLDSDAATALTGDTATILTRLVWRLLINLSKTQSRTITYLDVDPSTVTLETHRGYISYPNKSIADDTIRNIVLPPRINNNVSAVIFCASQVLHAGKDTEGGHFVSGYGLDENLES